MSIEKAQNKMNKTIETTANDLLKEKVLSDGMSVRIGGKLVKLQVVETSELPEDEIRSELTVKFNEKLQTIKDTINDRVIEMVFAQKQIMADLDKKEKELDLKMTSSNLMPDITYEQAKQGLSVVKGHESYPREQNIFTWLFSTVYWPKFIDNQPIDPKFSKKLVSPITIEIVTVGTDVRVVAVKKTIGLGIFVHYHSMSGGDCWGQWKHTKKWTTVDDIMSVAKQAQAVLENINSNSLGTRAPKGLSRIATIRKHVVKQGEEVVETKARRQDERIGITQESSTSDGVWTV